MASSFAYLSIDLWPLDTTFRFFCLLATIIQENSRLLIALVFAFFILIEEEGDVKLLLL